MDTLLNYVEQSSGPLLVALVAVVVFLWFLPALLALVFNRKHAKLIAIACIPAGLSFIAWGGLMVWATTGKLLDRFKDKNNVLAEDKAA